MELIADPLGRIISREDCLADFEGNDDPDPESGFSVYRSENLTVLAVVWQPDRGAPVHNHNGWAMEGVISGVEFNHNFERVDDGQEPWRAKLEEVEPAEVRAGEIMSLKLPPNDIHSVEIREGKTRAIHVYGNDLLKQWRYRFDIESGEVTPFRLGRRGPTSR
jgi:predicted metal-dependent enzyme (double-stranded beta helix superfamily)